MVLGRLLRAAAPLAELEISDLPAALDEVGRVVKKSGQRNALYLLLLSRWAEADGPAALAYADEKLQASLAENVPLRMIVLKTWARAHPEEAWRWAQAHAEEGGTGAAKLNAWLAVFSGLAADDWETTLQRFGTLNQSQRSVALFGMANSASDATSRDRLLAWSASLPETEREKLRETTLREWALNDGDAALQWVGTLPEKERSRLRGAVAEILVQTNPEWSPEFLLQGAKEAEKEVLYGQMAFAWGTRDSQATGEWLKQQPQGPELDSARGAYAAYLSTLDAAQAMRWALEITEKDKRIDVMRGVYQLAGDQRPAVAAAIDASGLSPAEIKKLKEAPAVKIRPSY